MFPQRKAGRRIKRSSDVKIANRNSISIPESRLVDLGRQRKVYGILSDESVRSQTQGNYVTKHNQS